jgi:hypothetical protein
MLFILNLILTFIWSIFRKIFLLLIIASFRFTFQIFPFMNSFLIICTSHDS